MSTEYSVQVFSPTYFVMHLTDRVAPSPNNGPHASFLFNLNMNGPFRNGTTRQMIKI